MSLFTVVSNQNLTVDCDDKSIFQLVLMPEPGAASAYRPGDWLVLSAGNQSKWVDAVLQALSLSGDETVKVRRLGSVTARQALTNHLEISQLNPAVLNKLQRQHQIGDWSDRQAMIDYAYGRDVLDLIEAFPQLSAFGVEFLSLLAPLAPRYYSIASAPCAVGEQVHLLVKQVAYRPPHAPDRLHYGVVSHAVSRLQPGDRIKGDFKANPMFKLPEDPQTPVMMIGAGTGLAPFIGFMQQRAGESASDNTLFFGETRRDCAFLFESELNAWQERGVLTLFTAFSRDQGKKIYVQDRLWEQREMVWNKLQLGAKLYICGSQFGMAQEVQHTLERILCECGGMTQAEAAETWQAWRKSRHLQMDVY